jgi:hypothetical protein
LRRGPCEAQLHIGTMAASPDTSLATVLVVSAIVLLGVLMGVFALLWLLRLRRERLDNALFASRPSDAVSLV